MFWTLLCLWGWAAFSGLEVEFLDVAHSNQAVCFKPTLLLQRRAMVDEAVVNYLKTGEIIASGYSTLNLPKLHGYHTYMQLNVLLELKSIFQSGSFSSTPNLLYFPSLSLLDKNLG